MLFRTRSCAPSSPDSSPSPSPPANRSSPPPSGGPETAPAPPPFVPPSAPVPPFSPPPPAYAPPRFRFSLARLIAMGFALVALAVAGVIALSTFFATKTIFDLLGDNKKLREAIANLTDEDPIAYVKVLSQAQRDGRLVTRVLFVETDRDDPARHLLRQEFEIEGDVVHFDALIVKFSDRLVMDGKERALYLWRRIYGEGQPPEQGFPIEAPGMEPRRYAELFAKLPLKDRELFWSEIWALSNDPERLRRAGVAAIYGNAVYKRLRPGLIYVFKFTRTGAVYPETVPEL